MSFEKRSNKSLLWFLGCCGWMGWMLLVALVLLTVKGAMLRMLEEGGIGLGKENNESISGTLAAWFACVAGITGVVVLKNKT